ncbi:MAG: SPOR domain-containing protein [Aestuariivirga sp.]|uniref:SPOR domain-containing protein n=1 Tax=Aestuariivirga sp. TaxID=2650926 RepID=UPI0038D0BF60
MDQDSTNGSGPDKRNWRERLGIGAQELPKLSDEFRGQSAAEEDKTAARPPQPVVKPAPMAPRVARKPAVDQPAPPATAERPAAAASRATPRGADNAVQDALAEKLRAQRAAAERLAEQRVQAARQKAEGKSVPPRPAASGGGARPAAGLAGSRPKFGFADENRGADSGRTGQNAQSSLTPPRPTLGGERGQPPFLRPALNGSGAGRSASAFRPGDSGSGAATARLPPPGGLRGTAGGDSSAYGASRLPTRRPAGTELFARRSEQRDAAETEAEAERPAARLGRPGLSAPTRDSHEDVFEDEAPPRQRPTARDYQDAYEETDEVFADQQRRSSGPWLVFLGLLLAAIGLGSVFWYYGDSLRGLTGAGNAPQPAETLPVVKAPEEPAKVEAESSPSPDAEAPGQQKKLIYDRIVGDQEVTGGAALQSTEEIPVAPADVQPAVPVQEAQPPAPANQIPAPDAIDQSTTGQGLPEVEPPPPIPPPAPGQEGSLQQAPAAQVAAASAPPEPGATAPPPAAVPSPELSSSAAALPPPPETATDGAALVSETASAVDGAAAEAKKLEEAAPPPPPAEPQEAVQAPAPAETEAAPPPKKKQAAARKKQSTENFENLGSEPVVLVPPSQAPAQDQQSIAAAPPAQQAPPAGQPKRRTIFDIFERGGSASPSQNGQVAALEQPAPSPAPRATAPRASTGGGYLVQLSSFRSQADAQREYARLRNDFPDLVGALPQQIRETSVAGSTRYQLALGPIASRGEATKVCSELIAGGESDCIVRGP